MINLKLYANQTLFLWSFAAMGVGASIALAAWAPTFALAVSKKRIDFDRF